MKAKKLRQLPKPNPTPIFPELLQQYLKLTPNKKKTDEPRIIMIHCKYC